MTELPTPSPAAGEVRVRIVVSGVNPSDVKARAEGRGLADGQPQIPHQDGAGVIDAVGAGVEPGLIGTRVWVFHAAHGRSGGTAAEFLCLPRWQVVALPADASFEVGASLGIPYMTAHRCVLDTATVAVGTILVTGGAGAVGVAAVQLATWAGAQVIATVSSPEKADAALRAGAYATVDYRRENVSERLGVLAPDGIHRVVDVALATNLASYVDRLAPGAVIAAYAGAGVEPTIPFRRLMRRNASLRFVHVYGLPRDALRRASEDINRALVDGALAPVAHHHFELAGIADAHEAVEHGRLGKVLVHP